MWPSAWSPPSASTASCFLARCTAKAREAWRWACLSLTAALLTLPAFWTGLPLVLGAAGVVLGHVGRHRSSGSGKSIAAVVIGALVVIGYLSIYIVDGLVFGNL